jgi:glyoxylase-like metal-dependent hydrolase (beta-lactamase superfamily II)
MRLEQGAAPPVGIAQPIGRDLRRILAPNPSPMTFWGTNTYLLGQRQIAVFDPGPDSDTHLTAILDALTPGQSISHIFVTHAHLDHSPLAPRLAQETGAPVLAFGDARAGRSPVMEQIAQSARIGGGEGIDSAFSPDVSLKDHETVAGDGWSVTALWTPGHFGNHLCFDVGDTVLSGDLVMGWASSLVSPPDGDLTQFMASCARLRTRAPKVLLPGHGAPVTDPAARLDWLLAHRRMREAEILSTLADGAQTAAALAARIYTDTPPALLPAASRNVLAHLIDLTGKSLARPLGPLDADTLFEPVPASPENS